MTNAQCRQIGGTSGFVGERFRTEQFEISGGGKVQKVGGDALKLEGAGKIKVHRFGLGGGVKIWVCRFGTTITLEDRRKYAAWAGK